MIIENPKFLRSLRNEAERQADFYHRRGDTPLFEFWNDLSSEVTEAMQRAEPLQLLRQGIDSQTPIPIKACEQGQQPRNHTVIKAFQ